MAALEIRKKVANATLYVTGEIKIEHVRFSYPHLDKPYAGKPRPGEQAQTAKYGVVAMLPKRTHVEAKDLIVFRINEILKENDNATVSADKKFLRNGDDQENESYKDHWICSAREERRPTVRDGKAVVLTEQAKIADMFYGGCWGHVLIRPWYQDGKKVGAGYGKRLNAGLVSVMFWKDDEPFGQGRIDDTEAWGPNPDSRDDGLGDGFDKDGL